MHYSTLKHLPFCLILGGLLLAMAGCASLSTGLAAHQSGNFNTAYSELKPLAEQGNAVAQLTLGSMYQKGQGVNKNSDEAITWYRRAAEQGNAEAQYQLGGALFSANQYNYDESAF